MDTIKPPIPPLDPSADAGTEQPATKEVVLPRPESTPRSTPFRILSLDGGGIRGLLSARILQAIERQTGARLYDQVDFFAGTSTGSILAAGLACGYPLEQIVRFYHEETPKIFADSWWDNVKDLGPLLGAQYDIEPLKQALSRTFGIRKLGDLDRRFLAVSFELKSDKLPYAWKPKVFHNFPGADSDADELVVDVVLRSCAVPAYFPVCQGYVDGGVTGAVNPTMCAVAQALDGRNEGRARPQLSDLLVLSVGTGRVPKFVDGVTLDWGFAKWAPYLVDLSQEAPADMAHFQCRQVLGERYHRVQPMLLRGVALDDPKETPCLEEVAGSRDVQVMINGAVGWVERVGYFSIGRVGA